MVKYYVSRPEKDFGWNNELKQDQRDQSLVYSETIRMYNVTILRSLHFSHAMQLSPWTQGI